ncbi:histidine phosphatase family protein [Aurantibacter crassamenti]|uniref:SixA phosphatase family protein n=1 Tax=Aurantibacter crassamenti TaxID=1837375 RepID=UPI00193AB81A|nr:histidine phosphatase family protein [Aurantibacter crassamenti]MBM1107858.1 histidine phosphatase family protein [Aurantibacter crassamenti]
MKKILLVRHGKSSWEYSVSDRDRPLSERGINDALLVSTEVLSNNLEIDAVYSSPANRALHTCTIFLRQLNFPFEKLEVVNELYDFSGDDVLQFIRNIKKDINTVMIFGHNHAFTHIANSLGNTYIDNVPTSGYVALEFKVEDWSKISKGTTLQTIFPKHLRA